MKIMLGYIEILLAFIGIYKTKLIGTISQGMVWQCSTIFGGFKYYNSDCNICKHLFKMNLKEALSGYKKYNIIEKVSKGI